jgi:hypothetical protein
MTSLLICRLEHKVTKKGPYSDLPNNMNRKGFWRLMETCHISRNPDGVWAKKHPSALQEFGDGFLKLIGANFFHEVKFGFTSLHEMEQWFGTHFLAEACSNFKFQIGFYRVPTYYYLAGKKQTIYLASKAEEVKK